MKNKHLQPFGAAALLALAWALAACSVLAPPGPPPPLTQASLCLADLGRQGIVYQLAPIPAAQTACHVDNPVRIMAAGVAWSQPGIVDCDFALRLESFTREVVVPVAQGRFHQPVIRLDQVGALSCRSNAAGHLASHATGNAIDIAGFALADGSAILVERDWHDPGPRGDFLRDIARRACIYFDGVQTPNADPTHANSIHLEAGAHRQCGL